MLSALAKYVINRFIHVIVCPFVPFLLAIVLSVLRFMASNYPFGICTRFLQPEVYIFLLITFTLEICQIIFCHIFDQYIHCLSRDLFVS
jgi:hypothetical protein